MTTTTVTVPDSADELSEADLLSLHKIADQVAHDETLTERARHLAVQLVRAIASEQDAAKAEYLSPNQAATLVGVSRPIVNRLLDEGRIPYYATPGGHRRIKRSDVEAYLENRETTAYALSEARKNRLTAAQQTAVELDMTPEQAKRLGFS